MAKEHTLAIIKPEAYKQTRPIITDILNAGFEIIVIRFLVLTENQAKTFYSIHKGKSFFENLVKCMNGPVTAMALVKENAVAEWRKFIGTTNPKEAAPGTLRCKYAYNSSLPQNFVHGSDSLENAEREIKFFFAEMELELPYGYQLQAQGSP